MIAKAMKITKETNEIQRVVALRNSRNKRHRTRQFIVEGTTSLDQAKKYNWSFESLFYNGDRKLSNWATDYLNCCECKNTYNVTSEIMGILADRDESPEIVGVAATRKRTIKDLKLERNQLFVVLDEPNSPGNMGTLIRSAKAFGVDGVIVSGHAADEYDPKCIRSSVGTFFSMSVWHVDGIGKFKEWIESWRASYQVQVLGTGNRGNVLLSDVSMNFDIGFLVLGNETTGISEGFRNFADQFVRLPLEGEFTSLNVGVAGSIFLYEFSKNMRCRNF